jgi:Gas vesicle protein G
MGLLTGLLTLPLAPVRGTVWIAEKLQEQAEAELHDDASIHAALNELEELRQAGELDEAEIAAAEDALIEQLVELRRAEGA